MKIYYVINQINISSHRSEITMIKLITPCKKYLTSYIEAYYEYKEQNITSIFVQCAASIDIFEKFDNFEMSEI